MLKGIFWYMYDEIYHLSNFVKFSWIINSYYKENVVVCACDNRSHDT